MIRSVRVVLIVNSFALMLFSLTTTHTHRRGTLMKFSRFVKLVQAGLGDCDPEIDYIDVDLCYHDFDDPDNDSIIAVEPGREEGTIKIWLRD